MDSQVGNMKIKFLGSGSAFVSATENFQSNVLITEKDSTLLYDCGTTISEALLYNKIELNNINNIYISHLHADHAGGIEHVAFKTYFSSFPFGENKPRLIAHPDIIIYGWEHTWKGGLESIQGKRNNLSDYFDITAHPTNGIFFFEGVEFLPVSTTHVKDDIKELPSFGLSWEYNKHKVFITGDCQLDFEKLKAYYEQSTIIFHDCEFMEYPNSVHAQFHQLEQLPSEIKAKMWLYHYQLNDIHIWELEQTVIESGFAGIVRRGQEFDLGIIKD